MEISASSRAEETFDIRLAIRREYERRHGRNPRYSMRAYARSLRTHHSTLSQIIERRRRLTARTIAHLGRRLGLSRAQLAEACVQEHADSVLMLLRRREAKLDSRWIATRLGIPLDDVNRALHRLLWQHRLSVPAYRTWSCREH